MNETEKITEAPKDCSDSGSIWETGKSLFQYDHFMARCLTFLIKKNKLNESNIFVATYIYLLLIYCYCVRYIRKQVLLYGLTGRVAFDDNGDRIFAEYDIINIQNTGPNRMQVSVGQYFYPTVSN